MNEWMKPIASMYISRWYYIVLSHCACEQHTVCEQTNSHLHVSKLIESMGPWDTWTWHLTRYLKRIIQTSHNNIVALRRNNNTEKAHKKAIHCTIETSKQAFVLFLLLSMIVVVVVVAVVAAAVMWFFCYSFLHCCRPFRSSVQFDAHFYN